MRAKRIIALGALAMAIPPIAAAVVKARRPSRGDDRSDEIDLVTIFDDLEFHSTAPAFRGGRVLCWYGGGTLDLTGATLDPDGARLRVTNVFGGLALRVPLDWRVEMRSKSMFGGAGDGRPTAGTSGEGPLLTIDAVNLFGGLGIVGPSGGVATEAPESA